MARRASGATISAGLFLGQSREVAARFGFLLAIPAVLAYNAFVRANRVYLAQLDAFAHDLFTFLSTGQQAFESTGKVRRVSIAASKGE